MPSTIVAGNWKSNGRSSQLVSFLTRLKTEIAPVDGLEVLLFPPACYLHAASSLADSIAGLATGSQDHSVHADGAFTGEISAEMVADCGAAWALCGHSERRHLYAESCQTVAGKIDRALSAGLCPVICVGERLEERESGRAAEVVLGQLEAAMTADVLALVKAGRRFPVVAYEPVWAIGTGRVASPEDAQAMHAEIRRYLLGKIGETAKSVQILYGGSVKASNAAALFAQEDIDGALVGGASLEAEEFLGIIGSV